MLFVTHSNEIQPGIRKRAIKREIIIGPTAIKFITIAIFAILALVYLTQSTANANRSIKVRDVSDKKANYEEIEKRLEDEKTRLQSLERIDQETPKIEMEPVSRVDHLNDPNQALARN